MEKDRKVEKFHAELIIRQQKCGKVDLKGLSASQAEFFRREIWRKFGPHAFDEASQFIENINYILTWCKKNPI